MAQNVIECKEIFGLTVCKFNMERVIFNAMSQPINVDVFTSDNCPFCQPAIDKVNELLTPLGDMVNINVFNKMEDAQRNKVEVFPTTQIGETRIKGVPEREMLWKAILTSSPTL